MANEAPSALSREHQAELAEPWHELSRRAFARAEQLVDAAKTLAATQCVSCPCLARLSAVWPLTRRECIHLHLLAGKLADGWHSGSRSRLARIQHRNEEHTEERSRSGARPRTAPSTSRAPSRSRRPQAPLTAGNSDRRPTLTRLRLRTHTFRTSCATTVGSSVVRWPVESVR